VTECCLLAVLTSVEMCNKYQVKNTLGQQVYFAGEGTMCVFAATKSILGQLSLASLRGRLIEYQLRLGHGQECHLCRVAGNTVIICGM